MKKDKLKNRKILNIVYITLIVIILFSNIFGSFFEKVLRLKPVTPSDNFTSVHFIDVGQGDCVAIKFSNGKTMLVDSGTLYYQKKLSNYLDNVVLDKDKTIDYLVLTHTDSDHMSNMEFIVNKYNVGTFYRPPIYLNEENKIPVDNTKDYRDLLNALDNKNVNIVFNDQNCEILDENIKIKWLYPDINDLYGYDNETLNNLSCVLLIEDNNKKILLTGDIDSTIETALINIYGDDLLDVDILKLAHHGSNYSTSSLFLETTTPNYLVASVGDNSYGHPGKETINRILQYDKNNDTNLYDNFYTTKNNGNIIFSINNNIELSFIKNIDNYSFCSYYIYTIIAVVFLLYFMLIPYIIYFIKNKRSRIYNKKYREEKRNNK